MNTNDPKDRLVVLNEEMDMVWGIRMSDPLWYMHNERGYFKLNINEDLGNP